MGSPCDLLESKVYFYKFYDFFVIYYQAYLNHYSSSQNVNKIQFDKVDYLTNLYLFNECIYLKLTYFLVHPIQICSLDQIFT